MLEIEDRNDMIPRREMFETLVRLKHMPEQLAVLHQRLDRMQENFASQTDMARVETHIERLYGQDRQNEERTNALKESMSGMEMRLKDKIEMIGTGTVAHGVDNGWIKEIVRIAVAVIIALAFIVAAHHPDAVDSIANAAK